MRSFLKDYRTYVMIIPALLVLCLVDQPVAEALLFSLSAVILIIGAAHMIRKAMFPYIDLRDAVDLAETTPLSGALLFLGVVLFFSVVLTCSVWWVRG